MMQTGMWIVSGFGLVAALPRDALSLLGPIKYRAPTILYAATNETLLGVDFRVLCGNCQKPITIGDTGQ